MDAGRQNVIAIQVVTGERRLGTSARAEPALDAGNPAALFVAPAGTKRLAPWTEVLLMNMILSTLVMVLVCGAPLLSALAGSVGAGAILLVPLAIERRRARCRLRRPPEVTAWRIAGKE
jgi:hypothetical protein